MKKQYIIILTIVLVLTSGILLAFNTKTNKASTCDESTEQSCQKKSPVSGGMLWENLSQQFSTSAGF
jgi:hypothetical protein